VVVYKLGGSLLDLPDLAGRLANLLRGAAAACRPVVVVGGGTAADAVRGWGTIHRLSDAAAHELAIAAMDFNARLIREILVRQGLTVVSRAEAQHVGEILVPEILNEVSQADAAAPPATWDVTSDSLAAWLARRIGAARLVLVKSVEAPPDRRLATAASEGLVDPLLTRYAEGLTVAWINLRNDPFQEWAINP